MKSRRKELSKKCKGMKFNKKDARGFKRNGEV
jgi:hypothetical protein